MSARFSGSRRGHHENHFVGRLFESFQQRVRGFVGQHVRFVEDHDFVACRRARSAPFRAVRESGRCRGWTPRRFRSRRANFPRQFRGRSRIRCRVPRRALRAIERLGEDARRGRFAHAARAGKNVRVRHAAVLDGVGQRAVTCCCPTTSANVCGRHFRAMTW